MCVCVVPELDAVQLARLVFNRLFEVCDAWMKDFPYRRRPSPYYETSIHAIKNMRRKMEDKHVIIPDFNTLFNIQVCWNDTHTHTHITDTQVIGSFCSTQTVQQAHHCVEHNDTMMCLLDWQKVFTQFLCLFKSQVTLLVFVF